jgi:hypothetical protein
MYVIVNLKKIIKLEIMIIVQVNIKELLVINVI